MSTPTRPVTRRRHPVAVIVLLTIVSLLTTAGTAGAADPCGPGAVVWIRDGVTQCIHVDDHLEDEGGGGLASARDRAPAATEGTREGPSIAALGDPVSRAAVPWRTANDRDDLELVCDRSGDRHRIQVLYAHTGTNRLARHRTRIERTVVRGQSQYDLSSDVHGASTAWIPRFVTDHTTATCRLSITPVRVSSAVVGAAPDVLFDDLSRRGFDDADRAYLVMVDAEVYCGLGSVYPDDRADPRTNRNNRRPEAAFARIDRGCWDDEIVVAHEIGHNLGAVQWSAPNATSFGHCTDLYGVMCYVDGSPRTKGAFREVCTSGISWAVLDCGGDDYFNPSPGRGSYLRGHWNTVDSDWLLRTPLASWSRGGSVGASGTWFDDVGFDETFARDISELAAAGVTRGCNSRRTRFCPTSSVTREQMAAFLVRALDLPRGSRRFGDVPARNQFRDDVAALARAGITTGCNPPANTRFCPDRPVTRQEMAAFLTRALNLRGGSRTFSDVPRDSVFRDDVAALAAAGITTGCNPPRNTRFCPRDPVTREQMAAFLRRGGLLAG